MEEHLQPGWYREGDGPERLHDGTGFTGHRRKKGERTGDGLPLFVWEKGGPIPSGYPGVADQYRQPGWRQVTLRRSTKVALFVGTLVVVAFSTWMVLQNAAG